MKIHLGIFCAVMGVLLLVGCGEASKSADLGDPVEQLETPLAFNSEESEVETNTASLFSLAFSLNDSALVRIQSQGYYQQATPSFLEATGLSEVDEVLGRTNMTQLAWLGSRIIQFDALTQRYIEQEKDISEWEKQRPDETILRWFVAYYPDLNSVLNAKALLKTVSIVDEISGEANQPPEIQNQGSAGLASIPYDAPNTLTLPGGTSPYSAKINLSAGNFTIQNGQTVTFRAGQAIDLTPGFTVAQGASFDAFIDPEIDLPPPPPPPPPPSVVGTVYPPFPYDNLDLQDLFNIPWGTAAFYSAKIGYSLYLRNSNTRQIEYSFNLDTGWQFTGSYLFFSLLTFNYPSSMLSNLQANQGYTAEIELRSAKVRHEYYNWDLGRYINGEQDVRYRLFGNSRLTNSLSFVASGQQRLGLQPAFNNNPPQFYTERDIVNYLESISFEDQLAYNFTGVNPAIIAGMPSAYGSNNSNIASLSSASLSAVHDYPSIQTFQTWDKGDLIFSRGISSGSLLVSLGSYYTHVGIVSNPREGEVFESYVREGVKEYPYTENWTEGQAFARRKVNLSRNRIVQAVDNAIARYANRTPYFPQLMNQSDLSLPDAAVRFLNKNYTDSMYCSELVWHTFNAVGIDLDSNRIHLVGPAAGYIGPRRISNSLFVFPEEIYLSPYLTNQVYNKIP